ncbi:MULTISPECIES: allantoate amidohydrolase [unclassified Cryobacterium]|uniref:allantoate amidohydrolase n=1 Tax=unclassified Cryobacterium TaxID=2649013 RepID=UPI00106C70D7|nr:MULTISPECIES: allantoate amidohydrolase [unclassified Cryobacterium]TFC50575.1 allantoate amidohydrolase [Cryobacterium sp. TMB3-1-2]TFC74189.1 allantoate amidohydrolase [Cryobacterium sp. TMB3-10]TFC74793.1 allantoate amidohydrolase [Cryobacterium sp. TMB3-15]TFD41035.1 allantoate amidohydrolase [Cryobacterium sp. TMB3-12]
MPDLIAHGLLAGLDEIADTGRDRRAAGYSRHLWEPAEHELRAWFTERAERLGLAVETDRNGNTWAWWGEPGADAVVVGSHLDSVPGGGAYDGPLGVVSALDAVARLQAAGFVPSRPCAVLVFAEEEGSRFGVACLGSRLLSGAIDADTARALTDRAGITLAEAAKTAGLNPAHMGRDQAALDRIGIFLELHVEQGRRLIDLGEPVAVASSILAHGRWRLSFTGQGNHAGATPMTGRRDPMVAAAHAIVAVQKAALANPGARATVGRIEAIPGGTNVIPSAVTAWLDARADTDDQARAVVADITARLQAPHSGCAATVVEESWTGTVTFDPELAARLALALGGVPALATGAGHDAGVLAARLPTAMLFVRNPTGISHSPEEFATLADCLAGVEALDTLLRELL